MLQYALVKMDIYHITEQRFIRITPWPSTLAWFPVQEEGYGVWGRVCTLSVLLMQQKGGNNIRLGCCLGEVLGAVMTSEFSEGNSLTILGCCLSAPPPPPQLYIPLRLNYIRKYRHRRAIKLPVTRSKYLGIDSPPVFC